MDYNKLAELLFPNLPHDYKYYLDFYKKRNLPNGAQVMRFSPSPTGFFHIGGLYSALISHLTTKKTNGVFYLRIEDTDQKREIAGAGDIIYNSLLAFNVVPDEGYRGSNLTQLGEYGPYIQSQRKDIYLAFAKELVRRGRAFPCFCQKTESKEDVLERRQEMLESEDGLISKDICRNLSYEQIEQNIKQGKPFALRLKSQGNSEKSFKIHDLIKGDREIRENDKDVIILKSNHIPPYNLAHVVDDTLMGTTIVVRGDEWYASLASHLEIFDALSLSPPQYAHTPVASKIDSETGTKRKLSKRKDAEADIRFYFEKGYPTQVVIDYCINLLNSDFESWRNSNPDSSYLDFDFRISKIGSNNPMYDIVKLNDISKNYFARQTKEYIYNNTLTWAKEYDEEFYNYLINNKDYALNVFNIDREVPKPRKDIACFSEIKNYFSYMFDYTAPKSLNEFELGDNIKNLLEVLKEYPKYLKLDTKDEWFANIKVMAEKLGYATDNKAYKQNPEAYKGNTATVCEYIRIGITGRKNSPDLYTILTLLGKEKSIEKLNLLNNLLTKE